MVWFYQHENCLRLGIFSRKYINCWLLFVHNNKKFPVWLKMTALLSAFTRMLSQILASFRWLFLFTFSLFFFSFNIWVYNVATNDIKYAHWLYNMDCLGGSKGRGAVEHSEVRKFVKEIRGCWFLSYAETFISLSIFSLKCLNVSLFSFSLRHVDVKYL